MALYIGNEKIGGGLITKVNALPEANATNYAKNQLYLYENKLYFIVLDGSTYKMKKLGEDAPSGYQVTITASEAWANPSHGIITFYDGQDNTGDVLLTQNPADKSAYPLTLSVSSGYLYINIYAPDQFGVSITSNDYSTISNAFIIDKDGTINIQVVDFYD